MCLKYVIATSIKINKSFICLLKIQKCTLRLFFFNHQCSSSYSCFIANRDNCGTIVELSLFRPNIRRSLSPKKQCIIPLCFFLSLFLSPIYSQLHSYTGARAREQSMRTEHKQPSSSDLQILMSMQNFLSLIPSMRQMI